MADHAAVLGQPPVRVVGRGEDAIDHLRQDRRGVLAHRRGQRLHLVLRHRAQVQQQPAAGDPRHHRRAAEPQPPRHLLRRPGAGAAQRQQREADRGQREQHGQQHPGAALLAHGQHVAMHEPGLEQLVL